jgi:hypothetical protein
MPTLGDKITILKIYPQSLAFPEIRCIKSMDKEITNNEDHLPIAYKVLREALWLRDVLSPLHHYIESVYMISISILRR